MTMHSPNVLGQNPAPETRSRKKPSALLTFLFGTLSFGLMVSGCTKNETTNKNNLIVALSASPSTLDPRRATDATGSRLAGLLFSSLVKIGPGLKIVGDAAESWEYKDRVYTFYLRPNLKFSNGKAVTAEDIKSSFEQFMSPSSPFASSFRVIQSVEVEYGESARFVRIALKEPMAPFLYDLPAIKILPKDLANFSQTLTGSGPFEFVSMDANQIHLKARKDHTYLAPKTENLIFKIIRDDNTRFLKVLKGEIDIAQQELPPSKVMAIEKKGDFQIIKKPGLSMTYILLNLKDPLLSNRSARVGIAHAINRQELIDFKLAGLAQLATSVLSPANPYHNADLTPVPYNFEKAKELLNTPEKNKKELILKTSNTPSAIENGRVIANQLEKAGLNVKLQSYEWGTFYSDVQKGNFQLATLRWVGTIDPDIYRKAFHSKELPPLGRNRGFYKNVSLDASMNNALRIEDESRRRKMYQEIQQTVFIDMPIIPLWYDMEVAVLSRGVQGYFLPENGDYSSLVEAYKK